MGCGSSKLDHVGDVIMVPAKLRPILQRKFEDIKRHARNSRASDFSRKELLKAGGYCVSSSDYCSSYQSPYGDSNRGSSQEESMKTARMLEQEETLAPEMENAEEATTMVVAVEVALNPESDETFKDAEENLAETPLSGTPKAAPGSGLDGTREELEEKVKVAEFNASSQMRATKQGMSGVGTGDAEAENTEEDDDDGSLSADDHQRYICPGSPSFRVYYIESLDRMKDEDQVEDEPQRNSQSEGSAEVTESVKSNRGLMKKMRKKGGKLKRVIPKPRPSAVTKLLKVKSCCDALCTGQPKNRLTASKAKA